MAVATKKYFRPRTQGSQSRLLWISRKCFPRSHTKRHEERGAFVIGKTLLLRAASCNFVEELFFFLNAKGGNTPCLQKKKPCPER